MKEITFITGNEHKLREAIEILGVNIQQKSIDLPEIQSVELKPVIEAKLKGAYEILQKPVIVEDVGFFSESLNGLPGALIKWFIETLGRDGIVKILEPFDNKKVTVVCAVGYTEDGETIHVFEGKVNGIVVPKRGESGFGFDPIFEPEGHSKTFAEMSAEEKNAISHRGRAFEKFKEFLEKNNIG
ncbi:MAG: RdgB/HAM1 family non-canonical purine NTP pyrophosphatase [Nanoarchaeota archaeon]|nr:RdgB/HAM1 family non-canonical purine NTP pyrophosphatase [Nanoarchaeota archaeon]MCG2718944.1 RdgB/HAM1 family non-canonical purine NTP pyrophosphatase [Nanoarchaeota archaeon]